MVVIPFAVRDPRRSQAATLSSRSSNVELALTVLPVGAGRIPLQRGEWFTREQATQLLQTVLTDGLEPDWIRWRDISADLRP